MFQRKKMALICLAVALCCIVIAVGIFLYSQRGKTSVDWKLNGQIITADGTVEEQLAVKVKGSIIDRKNENEKLTLDISFPSDFRYLDDSITNGGDLIPDSFEVDYYGMLSWARKRDGSGSYLYLVCIDPEMGYFLCRWNEDPDRYLVASVDENVTPEQILEHFRKFVDVCTLN